MKEKAKGFIAGIIVCVLAFSLVGGALAASQTISIDSIKVMVNGEEFKPKDVNGNDVLVFSYNGTTYAPLRALAEAYGLVVGYDSAANMATVDMPTTNAFDLGIGTYTVGTDIAPGKYDIVAISGSGNFQGDVASCQLGSLNEILAAPGEAAAMGWSSAYSNLILKSGDIIYIKGNLNLQFTKK
jgi:hypothetical protein